jgi:hypothetical protein
MLPPLVDLTRLFRNDRAREVAVKMTRDPEEERGETPVSETTSVNAEREETGTRDRTRDRPGDNPRSAARMALRVAGVRRIKRPWRRGRSASLRDIAFDQRHTFFSANFLSKCLIYSAMLSIDSALWDEIQTSFF